MSKKVITYSSPLEAIIALAKRLSTFEEKYGMTSEDFFDQFKKGQLSDANDFIRWSNDYQHFVALKLS